MLGEHREPQAPIIRKKRHAPKTHPCPICGKLARRKFTREFVAKHLAHRRPCEWHVSVGVYRAKCRCTRTVRKKVNGQWVEETKPIKFFTAGVPGIEHGQKYTEAVREKVVDLVIRDHLSNLKVLEHMREEHCLNISEGFIYLCLDWAQKKGLRRTTISAGVSRNFRASSA